MTTLVDGTITRIDPRTNQVTATIRTRGRPVHVAADDRAVWVAYPQDDLVRRIDPKPNQVVATLRVLQPQDVALGFGSVWVPSGRPPTVVRIDPQTNTVTATLPLASGLYGLAADDHWLWTVDFPDDTVTRLRLSR